jgi:Family of unknown function (DUF5994)
MLATEERRTATGPALPSRPRLQLQPDLAGCTLLDGGWWPRPAGPAAELPGLVGAIGERHGPVTRIVLGGAGWDASRPRRLRVDGPAGRRVVRLGWLETMPAGLLTATAGAGRTGLLTVPAHAGEPAARAARAWLRVLVCCLRCRPGGRRGDQGGGGGVRVRPSGRAGRAGPV